MTLLLLVIASVSAQRLLELRHARRQEAYARAQGAIEHGAGHYPLFVILHTAWLVGWALEAGGRGASLAPGWPLYALGFLAGQTLRYLAMRTLGERWTTRILVWPGRPPVRAGIFRWVPHPNYLGVALEIACGPLLFGAWVTALVGSILNAALLLGIRIPAEERALSIREPRPGPAPPRPGRSGPRSRP